MALEYDKKLTSRAQLLRKSQTREEALLWYRFLSRYPLRFRRQHPIGGYIVDFYCHKAKLVVELDGSQHCDPEAIRYDRERTEYLESQGLFVLRISNLDVLHRFSDVCEVIDRTVKSRTNGFPRGEAGRPKA